MLTGMAIAPATRQRKDHLKEIKWNFRYAIYVICTFNVRFKKQSMRLGIYYNIFHIRDKKIINFEQNFFFNQNHDIVIHLIGKYGDCYISFSHKPPKNKNWKVLILRKKTLWKLSFIKLIVFMKKKLFIEFEDWYSLK